MFFFTIFSVTPVNVVIMFVIPALLYSFFQTNCIPFLFREAPLYDIYSIYVCALFMFVLWGKHLSTFWFEHPASALVDQTIKIHKQYLLVEYFSVNRVKGI